MRSSLTQRRLSGRWIEHATSTRDMAIWAVKFRLPSEPDGTVASAEFPVNLSAALKSRSEQHSRPVPQTRAASCIEFSDRRKKKSVTWDPPATSMDDTPGWLTPRVRRSLGGEEKSPDSAGYARRRHRGIWHRGRAQAALRLAFGYTSSATTNRQIPLFLAHPHSIVSNSAVPTRSPQARPQSPAAVHAIQLTLSQTCRASDHRTRVVDQPHHSDGPPGSDRTKGIGIGGFQGVGLSSRQTRFIPAARTAHRRRMI